MTIDLNSLVRHSSEVISKVIDDQVVVVLPTKGQVKVLNEVGAFIWELMDGIITLDEIAEKIVEVYLVSHTQAQADILQFTRELLNKEMLVMG